MANSPGLPEQPVSPPPKEPPKPIETGLKPGEIAPARKPVELVRIGQAAEKGINGDVSTTEALAGIAGFNWQGEFRERIDRAITKIQELRDSGKLKPEEAEALIEKTVRPLMASADEALRPHVAKAAEVALNIDQLSPEDQALFYDIDIRQLSAELIALQAAGETSKAQVIQKELKIKQEARSKLPPENQLDKFALKLIEKATLPEESAGDPLSLIDDFFAKKLPLLIGNPRKLEQLAGKIGISTKQLVEISSLYSSIKNIEAGAHDLEETLEDYQNPGRKKSRETRKKALTFAACISALMMFMAYRASKEESGAAQQAH